jgi:PilZ domain-containing protein
MVGTTTETTERRAAAPRSNVMFAATLGVDGAQLAVRVRNLSETGALVEGATLPSPDTRIRLLRNTLSVDGSVVWSSSGRAGLRFTSVIDPRAWIKPGATPPAPSADQAFVDTIQAAARAGLPALPARPMPQGDRAKLTAAMPSRIVEELAYVRRLVESIGDELVSEPAVVCRHPAALQKFDLAAQILGQLGTVLLADDQVAAAEKIGQQELKARLLRKA